MPFLVPTLAYWRGRRAFPPPVYRISTGLAPEIPRFSAKIDDGTSPLANQHGFAKILMAKRLRGFAPWLWVAYGTEGYCFESSGVYFRQEPTGPAKLRHFQRF